MAKTKERLQLNIRGHKFELEKKFCLEVVPDGRLAALDHSHEAYCQVKQEYFFNRDPFIFNNILNFYVTGKSTSLSQVNQLLCHR